MKNKKMNKRYLVIIIIILLISAGVFGWLFWRNMEQKGGQKSEAEKINELLPETKCSFKSDGEANAKAIETKDLDYCSCMKDEEGKGNCQKGVMDVNYYDQAIAQYDPAICKNISQPAIVKACVSVVDNGVSSLKDSDPYRLAFLYNQSGNYDGAINLFSELLGKNPSDSQNLLGLAFAYANKGLAVHKEKEFAQKAFGEINKAKALDENNAEVYRAEGFVYEVLGDLSSSIASYYKAINLDPSNIQAYVGRGHANNMMGNLEGALSDFKKAASLDPDKENINIYAQLCRLESTRSDLFEEAIENCNTVAGSQSESAILKAESLQVLGSIYMKLGRLDEAESKLNMAITYSPNEANVYLAMAKLKIGKKDFASAQAMAEKAISLDDKKASAYGVLAYALYKQGNNSQAEEAALKGIEIIDIDPSLLSASKISERKNAYYVLANIYNATGEKESEKKYKEMGDAIKL